MYKLKVWLRHYFGLTTRESKSFLAWVVVVVIVLMIPTIAELFFTEQEPLETTIQELKVDSLLEIIPVKSNTSKQKAILQTFDPNVASQAELCQLGIPSKLAERICNYRNKGGTFRKAEDLAKIYGLDPSLFYQLKPYILIKTDSSLRRKDYYRTKSENNNPKPLTKGINSADTNDLKKIYGIGSTLAQRVVKFRNKLGGFVQKEQLYEVYGLDSTVVLKMFHTFVIDSQAVRKIKINTISTDSLADHPYVGKRAAKIITNYRSHHTITSREDLLKTKAIEHDKVEKLNPYLVY